MPVVRSLVNEIRFVLQKESVRNVEAAINKLKKQLRDLDHTVRVKADEGAFRQVNEAVNGVKRNLDTIRDKTVTIRENTIRTLTGGRGFDPDGNRIPGRAPREDGEGEGRGRRGRERGPSEMVAPVLGVGAGLFGAEAIVDATNSYAQLNAILHSVTANDKELAQVRDRVFEIARAARVEPEGVANLVANFKQLQPVTHQTNDQMLRTVDTITKMLALAHMTPAQNNRTIRQIDNLISAGQVKAGQLTLIRRDNNMFFRLLQDAAGGPDQLKAWIASKDNDTNGLINLLERGRANVQRGMNALPMTFGGAEAAIKGDVTKGVGKTLVDTGAVNAITTPVVGMFDGLNVALDKAAKKLGGYQNLVADLGITLGAFLTMAIAQTGAWPISIGLISGPWLLVGLAIAGVGLAARDLFQWAHGQPSLTALLIGDEKSWQPQIDKFKAAIKPATDGFNAAWAKEVSDPDLQKNLGKIKDDFHDLQDTTDKIGVSVAKFLLPGLFAVWEKELQVVLALFDALLWTINEVVAASAGLGTLLGGAGAAEDRGKLAAELKAHQPGTYKSIQDALRTPTTAAMMRTLTQPIGNTVPPHMLSGAPGGARSQTANTTINTTITQNIQSTFGDAGLHAAVKQSAWDGVKSAWDAARSGRNQIQFPGFEFGTAPNP
nr:tape measure protein [uncultured Lichenicoccus sp.]